MKPKALVVTGYGINCDEETAFALKLAGADSEIVHINDLTANKAILKESQILVFPGGFSYGDDTGSGKGLANKIRNNLFSEIKEFINEGKLVIGICNGFQVLVNLGLLPAIDKRYGQKEVALIHNDNARFECRWVKLKSESQKCVFTKEVEEIDIPVAHGEGKFYAPEDVLRKLKKNDQIAFRYVKENGERAAGGFPENPNGSLQDIAGICDETGRVFGLMPHPERAINRLNHPDHQAVKEKFEREGKVVPEIYSPALKIFENAVRYFDNASIGKSKYKESGVDIELGDQCSKIFYEAAKKTWENRKGKIGEIVAPLDDFSAIRMIDVSRLPKDSFMCLGFDGVGTKVEIAERRGKHETVAYDLLAMVCDDAVVRGGEPVIVGSVLDVRSLQGLRDMEFIKQLADGYVSAAKEAGVAVINGELAELGARVKGFGDFNYNWGAGLVWFARKDRLLTGREIKVGDKIVALKEDGFRSNGLSLARKILVKNLGENWHTNKKLTDEVLIPSRIYSRAVCKLNGGFAEEPKVSVHGVVHVTGGGVPGKLGRVLKVSGLGARLDKLYDPCQLMLKLQKLGNVEDPEAYKTWNMGQGMLIITPEAEKTIKLLAKSGIESKIAGEITERPGIEIRNKGYWKKQEVLKY